MVFEIVNRRVTDRTFEISLYFRYSESACDSLVPTQTEENYGAFNLGNSGQSEFSSENDDSIFDSPKEITSRNPPYDIELDFDRYRNGKEYTGKLHRETVTRVLTIAHDRRQLCTVSFIERKTSGYPKN